MKRKSALLPITARLPRAVVRDLARLLRHERYAVLRLTRSEFIARAVCQAVASAMNELGVRA